MTVLLLLALVVVLPAAGALLSERSLLQRALIRPAFRIGAPIVYRQHEVSTHPVADAYDVRPAQSAVNFTITASSTISASPKYSAMDESLPSRAITSVSVSGLTTPVCAKRA